MLAVAGAVGDQQPGEMAQDPATFAASRSPSTTTIGTCFTLCPFAGLPLWSYGKLEPILRRGGGLAPAAGAGGRGRAADAKKARAGRAFCLLDADRLRSADA